MKNKKYINALFFSISIVIAAFILGNAIIKRNASKGSIEVTGLGEKNFTSDLIVWEGHFESEDKDLKKAYSNLESSRMSIKKYLLEKGLNQDEIIFNSVNTNENFKTIYSNEGRYAGSEFLSYTLNQSILVESQDVEKIEKISREITEILNQGIQFYSNPPRYYFTSLADLKLEMIAHATEDARSRAVNIAEKSGSELGELIQAKMGIFQITGQNMAEEYTWGGVYNTSSKNKTASITMKLSYLVK